MKLHIGQTEFPGALRFHRGTITAKDFKSQHIYNEHPIRWWFGFSWFGKWFVGFIRCEAQRETRQ
jgi:hypothetical protein